MCILILTALLYCVSSLSSWQIHVMPSFLDLNNWSRVKASCDIHKYFQHGWSWVSSLNARSASTANIMAQIRLFSSLYKTFSNNMGLVASFVSFHFLCYFTIDWYLYFCVSWNIKNCPRLYFLFHQAPARHSWPGIYWT